MRGLQDAAKGPGKRVLDEAYYNKHKRLTALPGVESSAWGATSNSLHSPLLPRQSSHFWAFMPA